MRMRLPEDSVVKEGLTMSGRMASVITAVVLVAGVLLLVAVGSSQVPQKINYQMRITDSVTGEPEPGEHDVIFRIFDQESGGVAVWDETHRPTADETGVVSVILGSITPIDIDFDGSMWLEADVDGEALSPRREIVSVPYAFRAMEADHSAGSDSLGGVAAGGYSQDGHNHDDRYYTETELNSGGSVNDAANPVTWTRLKSVPAGFADGTDDVGGVGDGYSLDAADGSPVDAVYVDDDGDVGIGTTNAGANLHIYDNTNSLVSIKIENPNTGANSTERISFSNENGDVAGIAVFDDDSGYPAQMHIFNNRPGGAIVLSTLGGGLHVDNAGDVGIGTTNPTAQVEVLGSTNIDAQFRSIRASGATATFGAEVSEGVVGTSSSHPLVFKTDLTERMRISAGGNVGIGTDDPATDLEVESPSWQDIVTLGLSSTSYRLSLQSGSNWASLRGGNSERDDIVIRHTSGFVGINETNPTENLHVSGTAKFQGDDSAFLTYFNDTNSTGTAILGAGNGLGGYFPTSGCGVAGTGDMYAMFARAQKSGNSGQAAIWTYLDEGAKNVRINYRHSSGTHYKIYGDGLVSSVMATSAGKKTLVAPESPEAWIEDFGSGNITSGFCHVELDPLLLNCITVSEEHPIKVLVTLTSAIANQFYVEKGLTGFDVILVGEGAESVEGTFDYKVAGKWKDNEHLRFAGYEEPLEAVQAIEPERKAAGPESNM